MYPIYQMYLTTMSARFFHSADLEGLREGLTGSDDAPPSVGARRADQSNTGPTGRGFDRRYRAPGAKPRPA